MARLNSPETMWQTNWKDTSFWLEDCPAPAADSDKISNKIDVVIIGSGYTGLNAAIETARGGRSTLVLDAKRIGNGCSTRNGGQISTSVKPSLEKLTSKYGIERAHAIRSEGKAALEWIEERIHEEQIYCAFSRVGRFHAAHSPEAYETLARDAQILSDKEDIEAQVIPRAEQYNELGTDAYYGGVVFPRHASVDPAKYHAGLLKAARQAGASVVGNMRVLTIERTAKGFEIQTSKQTLHSRDVIVATNGYTQNLQPWLQRRVIPIGSYMIATEPLEAECVKRLFPKNRVVSDSRKVVYYYRLSPDGRRILFGGRVSANETDVRVSGPRLHKEMCRIFPDLHSTRISHAWMGTVAYSFDELAHIGVHDGVHYAMGYCGSGVSMASYFGMRIGQKVLGSPEGRTAFDDLEFQTRPFYRGKPWFLPAAVTWYRWRDQLRVNRKAQT